MSLSNNTGQYRCPQCGSFARQAGIIELEQYGYPNRERVACSHCATAETGCVLIQTDTDK